MQVFLYNKGSLKLSVQKQEVVNKRSFSTSSNKLFLNSQVGFWPHPEKAKKGGEDAFFVSKDGFAIGVADGVGGWIEYGIDPSVYSKSLMAFAKSFYENNRERDPFKLMEYAWKQCKNIQGSTTACIITLDDTNKQIRTANLGDSGFLVLRDWSPLYRSKAQQSRFNAPYQIGSEGHDVTVADQKTLDVKEGDLIILGTDGLFDNLYTESIISVLKKELDDQPEKILKIKNVADILAKEAQDVGKSTKTKSPFEEEARKHGYRYSGGKLDDITVVISYVSHALFLPTEFPHNGVFPTPKSKI